jgi:hypothetical protein
MIKKEQATWLKEYLFERCTTEEDHHTCTEIVETFRALWAVLDVAKHMVHKPPAIYSPNSRKGQLQEVIKPFMPKEKEPHD